MNLEDESLLSAYLDDELDPADRLVVEWSVESSTPLVEQLRSLVTARDAVAGLGRPPSPRDLAPAVAAHLAAARRRARFRALIVRPARVTLAGSGLAAMAASLIFAMIMLYRSTHEITDPTPIVADQNSQVAPRPHPIITPDPAPTIALNSTTTRPVISESRQPQVATPVNRSDEARERAYRSRIERMLGQKDVRRVLIVTDMIGASKRVQDLIEHDARKDPDFGRITVCSGIVVDPDRPEEAEVFAVVLDEPGCEPFFDRLRHEFRRLEVEEASPALVTQLTEVGQVAVFRGTEASPLVDPPGEAELFIQANRAGEKPGDYVVEPPDVRDRAIALGNPKLADPRDRFVGPPDLRPAAPPRSDSPVTVLVWVTRPGRH